MEKSTEIRTYIVTEDFTPEQFAMWKDKLKWWIRETMPSITDAPAHAERILRAACTGTTLEGKEWKGISQDFFKRVNQLCGFDLKTGTGNKKVKAHATITPVRVPNKVKDIELLPPIDIEEAMRLKEIYRQDLVDQYPHLSSKTYEPKVDELAETIIKSRMLSNDFLVAKGASLEHLSKLRESLHKQIGTLMDFLEISPKFMAARYKETETSSAGSLVARLESYGELWQEYEQLDSLRELIQKYHMLNSTRPDGTPQLNDWELWHQTRNRPIKFKCKCGEEYLLLGGFTPQEIEQALLQAQKVYGFGLEEIGETRVKGELSSSTISTDLPDSLTIDEPTNESDSTE